MSFQYVAASVNNLAGLLPCVQKIRFGVLHRLTPQKINVSHQGGQGGLIYLYAHLVVGRWSWAGVWFLEKLAHFDREVIPERRMHAKGSGAYGTFTVTHDITRYTKAAIFSEVGKKTELFTRFSTVAGERGAADAERDIRGFAIKFYTEEGNWDLVGNNTPVFFLRDPLKFPDLNHAVKRDPRTNMRSGRNNWDFWTALPEALHQVTIVMSDRGIPYSYRHMHGFGSHTFSLINAKNERHWVKFHFQTQQGIRNLTDEEAEAIIGKDRESHQGDFYSVRLKLSSSPALNPPLPPFIKGGSLV